MGRKSAGAPAASPMSDTREGEIAALKRRLAAEQKRADDADRDAVELADKLERASQMSTPRARSGSVAEEKHASELAKLELAKDRAMADA